MMGDTAQGRGRKSDDGMGALERDEFEPALLRLIEPWLGQGPMPIVACGMVGARQGWCEAPYVAVPCEPRWPDARSLRRARDPRLKVQIMPGLKQPDPADVMRGEETQIAGFLAPEPGLRRRALPARNPLQMGADLGAKRSSASRPS